MAYIDCENCYHGKVCQYRRIYHDSIVAGEDWEPTAFAVPCKIGDTVWAIRNYSGTLKIVPGTVSEMYFISEKMKLVIVVKHVTRGTWGKDIFGSYEEAEKRLKECQTKN